MHVGCYQLILVSARPAIATGLNRTACVGVLPRATSLQSKCAHHPLHRPRPFLSHFLVAERCLASHARSARRSPPGPWSKAACLLETKSARGNAQPGPVSRRGAHEGVERVYE